MTLRGKPGVRRGSDFGNLEIIEDGSVFIKDGNIACVGSTRRLENLKEARGALQIPVHNCLVMPGFVDPYIKVSLRAPASRAGTVPKRRKLGDFYSDSVNLMRSCLQHGTLNVGINASSGIQSLGADLSVLRQLSRIGNNPVGISTTWSPEIDFLDMPSEKILAAAFETVARRKLAAGVELRHGFSEQLLNAAGKDAMRLSLDWPGGTSDDLEQALHSSSATSIRCHHKLSLSEQNVLAKTDAMAVFTAGGALLDDQPGDCVRDLIKAGGAIALASGYDAQYEPNFNMQLVLALAVRRLGLTIEQAIVASTINAAYAMNCGNQIGSLEPGKRAEVLVLNLSDYRELPRRLGVNHVALVIREGNLVINRTRWRVGAA